MATTKTVKPELGTEPKSKGRQPGQETLPAMDFIKRIVEAHKKGLTVQDVVRELAKTKTPLTANTIIARISKYRKINSKLPHLVNTEKPASKRVSKEEIGRYIDKLMD